MDKASRKDTVFEIIETCHTAQHITDTVDSSVADQYRKLSEVASEFSKKADFYAALQPGEIQYMEQYFGEDPSAKFPSSSRGKKAGAWKFSRLPKKYQTAKSAIGRGMDLGVLKKGMAKTELENAITEARKKAKAPVKPYTELLRSLRKVEEQFKTTQMYDPSGAEEEKAWEVFIKELKNMTYAAETLTR